MLKTARLLMMVEATRRELRRKTVRGFRVAFVEALRATLNDSTTNANYDTLQWHRRYCDDYLVAACDGNEASCRHKLIAELAKLAKQLETEVR